MPQPSHQDTRRKLSLEERSRSVPYKRKFIIAVISTLLFYLSIIAFFTAVFAFLLSPEEFKKGAVYAIVILIPISLFLWILSFSKRGKATCPLCKCTPFRDNLAHKHKKSFRVKPLNYGNTAIFNVLLTQRWRCMYCGTPFDILKVKGSSEPYSDPKKQ